MGLLCNGGTGSYSSSATAAGPASDRDRFARWNDVAWYASVAALAALAFWKFAGFMRGVSIADVSEVILLGLATMVRVFVLIAVASAIWVPVGVWIGLRPGVASVAQPIAQFLAAFPANLFFPIVVSVIVALKLNPNIWLSPLMILGTQWYILFNVVAGATSIPSELRDVGTNLARPRMALVAEDSSSGDSTLLRDGRHHRFGWLLERQHRR